MIFEKKIIKIVNSRMTSVCFKKIAQRALFECLDLPLLRKVQIFSFDKIMDYFKEYYPIGSILKIDSSSFEIVRYTSNEIVIKPVNQSLRLELLYDTLAKLMEKNLKHEIKGKDFKEILEPHKGVISYYYAIFLKLVEIYDAAKLQLIEEFYRGSYQLRKGDIKPFVLIIEEIDNCNIANVFGELIYLLDEDTRAQRIVRLPYSQEKFMVPENLYIIGTITSPSFMKDYKNWNILMRKFSFVNNKSDYRLVADFGCGFKEKFRVLNERISLLLGVEYQIGHGFFDCNKYSHSGIEILENLWFRHVYPRLRLYFKNDFDKLQALLGNAMDNDYCFVRDKKQVILKNNYKLDSSIYYVLVEPNTVDFDFYQALEHAFS